MSTLSEQVRGQIAALEEEVNTWASQAQEESKNVGYWRNLYKAMREERNAAESRLAEVSELREDVALHKEAVRLERDITKDAIATIKRLQAENARLAQERDDANGCLAMVRSQLVDYLGEDAMGKTPPMMYDAAIRRVHFNAQATGRTE